MHDGAVEEVTIAAPTGAEVLVRVPHSGVCASDLHVFTGDAGSELPMILGHEGAGVVAAQLGATETIDGSSTIDVVRRVRELTAGRGVDDAFEVVGHAELLEQCVEALAPGGTAVVVGLPPDGRRASFDVAALSVSEKTIRGCNYGSTRPSVDFPSLVAFSQSGRLALDKLVTHSRPLAEVGEALDDLVAGRGVRCVLSCG